MDHAIAELMFCNYIGLCYQQVAVHSRNVHVIIFLFNGIDLMFILGEIIFSQALKIEFHPL